MNPNGFNPSVPRTEMVVLTFHGPRWLLPESITRNVPLNETWFQVLNREVNFQNINMTPENILNTLMVRTSKFQEGVTGHSADIDTLVSDFIVKYKRRISKYTVRIFQKIQMARTPIDLYSTPPPSVRQNVDTKVAGPSTSGPAARLTSAPPDPLETDRPDDNVNREDDLFREFQIPPPRPNLPFFNENLSEIDSSTGNGEEEEDIKSIVEQRIQNFGNQFLLQVRQDYRELKLTNKWQRVVARFPRGAYMISELFQE